MKALTKKLSITFAILISSSLMTANASLIGQDVDLALIYVEANSGTPVFIAENDLQNPITVNVVENDVEAPGFIDGFMDVNIESETLGVLFPGGVVIQGDALSLNDALGLGPLDFIGLLFANLSWGLDNPGEITGITNLQTNIAGFSESNVLFDQSNVAFNILDLVIEANSFVIVDLVVSHDIPEPHTVLIFALTLISLGFTRRK
ncbi:hypothetical protein [Aliiglaciecola litoralis]|uniref:PEP-CTERM protein-sorting domain-containing protein n=1 Tax=Aliiglaciecola litoralis TaxID=582857 RepID=A0ABN1LIJ0_9ALTE